MLKNSLFWEKSSQKRTKGRFNLLLLEYGEFFVDDIAVYQYPSPSESNGRAFFQCDALKVQGRLKLCTKSFIFEPSESRKPLIRFAFKQMTTDPVLHKLSPADMRQCTVEASGFFIFSCGTVVEMKQDDKIGPYKQIDGSGDYLFALCYSDISTLLGRMVKLRQVYAATERGETTVVNRLMFELSATAPTATFDSSKLLDFHEKLAMDSALFCKRIKPLVLNPGYIMITDARVYFQPAQLNNVGESTQNYSLSCISRLYKRRYLLRDTALEMIMTDSESLMFCFDTIQNRDYIYNIISPLAPLSTSRGTLQEMTAQWRRRDVSNFDYLMFLNTEAGRSLCDIAQYPVFPHILADYTSRSLDLQNPLSFRDLSKPIGALNPQRLEFYRERFQSMPPEDKSMGIPPPFLYGTHYSTPGYVLYYLVRVAPEHMLCLQNGKFDATDRMFISLADTWDSCLKNPADLKELIPEFFCCKSGDFLINSSDLDLGRRHNGERLNDVELPPWAKSPRDFIKKHMKALESDFVSAHIHQWIDLIFGVKQRGAAAVENDNLFYHVTYEGNVDVEAIRDPRERRALEVQIQEFGQTPRQIFSEPHPARLSQEEASSLQNVQDSSQIAIDNVAVLEPISANIDSASTVLANASPEDSESKIKNSHRPKSTEILSIESTVGHVGSSTKNNVNNDNDHGPDEGIVELGSDFQAEVERALFSDNLKGRDDTNTKSPNSLLSPTTASPESNSKVEASAEKKSGKTFFGSLGGTLGGTLGGLWATGSGSSAESKEKNEKSKSFSKFNPFKGDNGSSSDPKKFLSPTKTESNSLSNSTSSDNDKSSPVRDGASVALQSSEPFKAHSEAITGLSLSADGRTIASCSKDSTMKVLRVSVLEDASLRTPNRKWVEISIRRTFTASDPPLSGCCLLPQPSDLGDMTKFILASSWDNTIYSYSIPNACVVGKRAAHDDGVSALCCDPSGRKVASSCWDASVKLWSVNSSTGLLEGAPDVELLDHDTPVQCIAVDQTCRYVAAGAEDGNVLVWGISASSSIPSSKSSIPGAPSHTVMFNRQVAPSARSVSSVDFITVSDTKLNNESSIGIAHHCLLCSSIDGVLLCVDMSNKVIAAVQIDCGIRCIRGGNLAGSSVAIVGCSDGSIRVFSIGSGVLREINRHNAVHIGGVTALSCINQNYIVSGGEDGNVRVWTIKSD